MGFKLVRLDGDEALVVFAPAGLMRVRRHFIVLSHLDATWKASRAKDPDPL